MLWDMLHIPQHYSLYTKNVFPVLFTLTDLSMTKSDLQKILLANVGLIYRSDLSSMALFKFESGRFLRP